VRIGVTGAFGFLGANLVAAVLEREDTADVVAYSSRVVAHPLFEARRVTRVPLDVRDAAAVRRETAGLDLLFHLAGRISYARRDRRATWDLNVLGARNVFEAALANGVPRVVYVSSVNVLGPCQASRAFTDETSDPYDPALRNPIAFRSAAEALGAADASASGDYGFLRRVRIAYFDSKLAATELARRYHRERGLAVTIALPGTMVGAGDLHYEISGLVDRVYRGRISATFAGGTSFIGAADAGRGVLLAGLRGRAGESYIISGADDDNLSYHAFMRLVARCAHRAGRCVRGDFLVVPPRLARAVAALAETLAPSGALTVALARAGGVTHRTTSGRARRELGYEPRQTLEHAVEDCWRFLQTLEARPA
jgi:dihydroflavonol-4-reductase